MIVKNSGVKNRIAIIEGGITGLALLLPPVATSIKKLFLVNTSFLLAGEFATFWQ